MPMCIYKYLHFQLIKNVFSPLSVPITTSVTNDTMIGSRHYTHFRSLYGRGRHMQTWVKYFLKVFEINTRLITKNSINILNSIILNIIYLKLFNLICV